jgi:hypothetical protein
MPDCAIAVVVVIGEVKGAPFLFNSTPDCAIVVVAVIAEVASAPAKPKCNNVLLVVEIRSAIIIALSPYGLVMKSCWNYDLVIAMLGLHINGT